MSRRDRPAGQSKFPREPHDRPVVHGTFGANPVDADGPPPLARPAGAPPRPTLQSVCARCLSCGCWAPTLHVRRVLEELADENSVAAEAVVAMDRHYLERSREIAGLKARVRELTALLGEKLLKPKKRKK